ncbi:hypothetical protein GCM10009409_05350 [Shewanella saliphila]|uniref:Lipoprotein n=1 Tax=Shewanella saliphila TaxID=2282698 RepID=A0ABQ2Q1W5_9GAMM|nr:hypothetical protein GCM10009409_05350 [Shewanella saliphila]
MKQLTHTSASKIKVLLVIMTLVSLSGCAPFFHRGHLVPPVNRVATQKITVVKPITYNIANVNNVRKKDVVIIRKR